MKNAHTIHTTSWMDVINILSDIVVFNHFSFDEFLKKLIKIVMEVIQVDSCLIYFYDREKKQLILVGSKKPHKDALGKVVLQKGEGITGWVAENKKTVAIEKEAYKDPRFKFFKELPEDKYESFLSVPIVDENGVVGVINLQNKKPYVFSKEETKTLESVVKIISSAFKKIILERKVVDLENKLEERKVVEKAKGILMKVKHMNEEQAYAYMRKEAMDKRKSIREIADVILILWD